MIHGWYIQLYFIECFTPQKLYDFRFECNDIRGNFCLTRQFIPFIVEILEYGTMLITIVIIQMTYIAFTVKVIISQSRCAVE